MICFEGKKKHQLCGTQQFHWCLPSGFSCLLNLCLFIPSKINKMFGQYTDRHQKNIFILLSYEYRAAGKE